MSTVRRALLLSHTHPHGPFRVGSHHYARVLARSGIEVVHLSTPISHAHVVTGRISRADSEAVPRSPHVDGDGVTHVTPRTALPRPYSPFQVARELVRTGIDPVFDAVLLDQPLLWDTSVRALSPRLVYRPTDLYPDGVKARLQHRIVAAADGVVATSAEVLRALDVGPLPHLVLENGVDAERFEATSAQPRPAVCVYVGALDGRFDWAQLERWARAHPEVRFAIAGPVASPASVPVNVELLGPVPPRDLPALLHTARVGLLPLSDDPLNLGRSPMKLHEYLAAGLSVVSRATPVIRDDAFAGLFTYTDAASADKALVDALASPSPNNGGAQRAAANSWEAKTTTLLAFLDSLPGARSSPS